MGDVGLVDEKSTELLIQDTDDSFDDSTTGDDSFDDSFDDTFDDTITDGDVSNDSADGFDDALDGDDDIATYEEGSVDDYEQPIFTEDNIGDYSPQESLKNYDIDAPIEVDDADAKPQAVIGVMLYKLLEGVIPKLKDIGLSNYQIVPIIKHIMFALVGNLDETGMSKFTMLTVLDEAVFGALNSLEKLSLTEKDKVRVIGNIAEGVLMGVSGLSSLDYDTKVLFFETTIYTLISRLRAVNGLEPKVFERCIKGIVGKSSRALLNLGLENTQMANLAVYIIMTAIYASTDLAAHYQNEEDPAYAFYDDFIDEFSAVTMGALYAKGEDFQSSYFDAFNQNQEVLDFYGEDYDYEGLEEYVQRSADDFFEIYGPEEDQVFAPQITSVSTSTGFFGH